MIRHVIDWFHRRVEKRWGCPTCGERDSDRLAWIEDGEAVECQSCGTVYVP